MEKKAWWDSIMGHAAFNLIANTRRDCMDCKQPRIMEIISIQGYPAYKETCGCKTELNRWDPQKRKIIVVPIYRETPFPAKKSYRDYHEKEEDKERIKKELPEKILQENHAKKIKDKNGDVKYVL